MAIYRLKGTSGAVLNQAFSLHDRLLIGPGAECQIEMENTAGDGPLAEVLLEEGGAVRVKSLAAHAGLNLNGEPIEESLIGGGDEIRIGTYRFILQAPGLKPERVLSGEAVKPGRNYWPWVIVTMAAAGLVVAWQQGWLDRFLT